MQDALREETVSQSLVFEGKILQIRLDEVRLPNGKKAMREVAEHPGGVVVAALNERQELLFVRQFRYPYGQVLLELPAGKLERGENPDEAIRRELLEETGAVGTDYRKLGVLYPSPGFCDEVLHLYACRVAEQGASCPDEDEFLEVERIPLSRAVEMVLRGEIPDAKTQVLVMKLALLAQKGAGLDG